MKTILVLLGALFAAATARADWKDLKPGMDEQAAIRCVGAPLMQSKNRGLVQIWTYDNRGYIEFANGTVNYFEAPKEPKAAAALPASIRSVAAKKPVPRLPGKVIAAAN